MKKGFTGEARGLVWRFPRPELLFWQSPGRPQPRSIGIYTSLTFYETLNEEHVLYYAAGAEFRQSHPIAKAIIDKAQQHGVTPSTPDATNYEVGYGIKVHLGQRSVRVGSARFMLREGLHLPE